MCYICDPSKVEKCVAFTQKVKKCVKLHDIALEEQTKKKEQNRLKRQRLLAAQQRAKSKRSDGESTDEEEIEKQLLGFVNMLDKMIQDENVDHATKRQVLAKVKVASPIYLLKIFVAEKERQKIQCAQIRGGKESKW